MEVYVMTDREKIDKIYNFAKGREDFYYKFIEDETYELGSAQYFTALANGTAYGQIRDFIEHLLEE